MSSHLSGMDESLVFLRSLSHLIGVQTGASDSLLHVHAGMATMFLARVLTRRSLATWTPFLIVLVAAVLKEIFDRAVHGVVRMPDSAFDILNTVFWPFVLMIGLRWRRAHPV